MTRDDRAVLSMVMRRSYYDTGIPSADRKVKLRVGKQAPPAPPAMFTCNANSIRADQFSFVLAWIRVIVQGS
jgi:hypothetical protein